MFVFDMKLILLLISCNFNVAYRNSGANVFSQISSDSNSVGECLTRREVDEENWEAETFIESRETADSRVISLEETSNGESDSDD
jgi:hypothetical protein